MRCWDYVEKDLFWLMSVWSMSDGFKPMPDERSDGKELTRRKGIIHINSKARTNRKRTRGDEQRIDFFGKV